MLVKGAIGKQVSNFIKFQALLESARLHKISVIKRAVVYIFEVAHLDFFLNLTIVRICIFSTLCLLYFACPGKNRLLLNHSKTQAGNRVHNLGDTLHINVACRNLQSKSEWKMLILHDRPCISPWIKSISNELDITIHVMASESPRHCHVFSNRLWRHQQNVNRPSETRGRCVKIIVIIVIYGFVMSCKK